MIQIKDVTKLYPAKEAGNGTGPGKDNGSIHALDHISLYVTQGEWLSIMGPSGSGKSTLVNLIGCLAQARSGSTGRMWLAFQPRN
jgi:putative ABC transport system ATP-binding protein